MWNYEYSSSHIITGIIDCFAYHLGNNKGYLMKVICVGSKTLIKDISIDIKWDMKYLANYVQAFVDKGYSIILVD